jgi:hypothetical protein
MLSGMGAMWMGKGMKRSMDNHVSMGRRSLTLDLKATVPNVLDINILIRMIIAIRPVEKCNHARDAWSILHLMRSMIMMQPSLELAPGSGPIATV